MSGVVTQDDVVVAIGYVVKEREKRRQQVDDPDERYSAVLEMNKVIDVLRLAEKMLILVNPDEEDFHPVEAGNGFKKYSGTFA